MIYRQLLSWSLVLGLGFPANASRTGLTDLRLESTHQEHLWSGSGQQKATSLDNKDDVMLASLAALALKVFLTYKVPIAFSFSAGLRTKDVVQHIMTADGFEEAALKAISEIDSLLNQVDIGTWSSESVRSEYLRLQQLRKDLRTIKSYCAQPSGLLHFFSSKIFPDASTSASIAAQVDEMDAVLSNVSDLVFCSRFQKALSQNVKEATYIAADWEARNGLLWFPKRSVPNREFSGLGPADSKAAASVKERWGLSHEQLEQTQRRALASAGRMGHIWFNEYTVFPDRIDADPMESNETKTRLRLAIRQIRVISGEMSKLSPACRENALQLYRQSAFCHRCPWCCSLRPFPFLTSLIGELSRIFGDDRVKGVMNSGFDLRSVVSAAINPASIPASIMWIATRLFTTTRRKEPCAIALGLLNNQSLPTEEAIAQYESVGKYAGEDFMNVKVELPEPSTNEMSEKSDSFQ